MGCGCSAAKRQRLQEQRQEQLDRLHQEAVPELGKGVLTKVRLEGARLERASAVNDELDLLFVFKQSPLSDKYRESRRMDDPALQWTVSTDLRNTPQISTVSKGADGRVLEGGFDGSADISSVISANLLLQARQTGGAFSMVITQRVVVYKVRCKDAVKDALSQEALAQLDKPNRFTDSFGNRFCCEVEAGGVLQMSFYKETGEQGGSVGAAGRLDTEVGGRAEVSLRLKSGNVAFNMKACHLGGSGEYFTSHRISSLKQLEKASKQWRLSVNDYAVPVAWSLDEYTCFRPWKDVHDTDAKEFSRIWSEPEKFGQNMEEYDNRKKARERLKHAKEQGDPTLLQQALTLGQDLLNAEELTSGDAVLQKLLKMEEQLHCIMQRANPQSLADIREVIEQADKQKLASVTLGSVRAAVLAIEKVLNLGGAFDATALLDACYRASAMQPNMRSALDDTVTEACKKNTMQLIGPVGVVCAPVFRAISKMQQGAALGTILLLGASPPAKRRLLDQLFKAGNAFGCDSALPPCGVGVDVSPDFLCPVGSPDDGSMPAGAICVMSVGDQAEQALLKRVLLISGVVACILDKAQTLEGAMRQLNRVAEAAGLMRTAPCGHLHVYSQDDSLFSDLQGTLSGTRLQDVFLTCNCWRLDEADDLASAATVQAQLKGAAQVGGANLTARLLESLSEAFGQDAFKTRNVAATDFVLETLKPHFISEMGFGREAYALKQQLTDGSSKVGSCKVPLNMNAFKDQVHTVLQSAKQRQQGELKLFGVAGLGDFQHMLTSWSDEMREKLIAVNLHSIQIYNAKLFNDAVQNLSDRLQQAHLEPLQIHAAFDSAKNAEVENFKKHAVHDFDEEISEFITDLMFHADSQRDKFNQRYALKTAMRSGNIRELEAQISRCQSVPTGMQDGDLESATAILTGLKECESKLQSLCNWSPTSEFDVSYASYNQLKDALEDADVKDLDNETLIAKAKEGLSRFVATQVEWVDQVAARFWMDCGAGTTESLGADKFTQTLVAMTLGLKDAQRQTADDLLITTTDEIAKQLSMRMLDCVVPESRERSHGAERRSTLDGERSECDVPRSRERGRSAERRGFSDGERSDRSCSRVSREGRHELMRISASQFNSFCAEAKSVPIAQFLTAVCWECEAECSQQRHRQLYTDRFGLLLLDLRSKIMQSKMVEGDDPQATRLSKVCDDLDSRFKQAVQSVETCKTKEHRVILERINRGELIPAKTDIANFRGELRRLAKELNALDAELQNVSHQQQKVQQSEDPHVDSSDGPSSNGDGFGALQAPQLPFCEPPPRYPSFDHEQPLDTTAVGAAVVGTQFVDANAADKRLLTLLSGKLGGRYVAVDGVGSGEFEHQNSMHASVYTVLAYYVEEGQSDNDDQQIFKAAWLERCIEAVGGACEGVAEDKTFFYLFLDLMKRRERLTKYVNELKASQAARLRGFKETNTSARELLIAMLHAVNITTQARILLLATKVGMAMPLVYAWSAREPSSDLHPAVGYRMIANFAAFREVLGVPASPLVVNLGSSLVMGKSHFLKVVFDVKDAHVLGMPARTSSPLRCMPGIDLIMDAGDRRLTLLDAHRPNVKEPLFAAALASLLSASSLVLFHVCKEDLNDMHELEMLLVLLKRHVAADCRVSLILRDEADAVSASSALQLFGGDLPDNFIGAWFFPTMIGSDDDILEGIKRAITTPAVQPQGFRSTTLGARIAPTMMEEIKKVQNDPKCKCPDVIELERRFQMVLNSPEETLTRMRPSDHNRFFALILPELERLAKGMKLLQTLFPLSYINTQLAKLHEKRMKLCQEAGIGIEDERRIRSNQEANDLHNKVQKLLNDRKRIQLSKEVLEFARLVKRQDYFAIKVLAHHLGNFKQEFQEPLLQRFGVLSVSVRDQKKKHDTTISTVSAQLLNDIQELDELELQMQETEISADLFWHELLLASKHTEPPVNRLPMVAQDVVAYYADWCLQGHPIHFLHGTPLQFGLGDPFDSHLAGDMLRDIIHALDIRLAKKIIVVSVIGVQSSGKSTLLNFLFGCSFVTHAGRCTTGLFISLAEFEDKVLVVLDTEGLLSVEARTPVFDKQVSLMALACSHLVIVNNKGEIDRSMQELFQVCLFAMKVLQFSRMKPTLGFVCQQISERVDRFKSGRWLERMRNELETGLGLLRKKGEISYDLEDLVGLKNDSIFMLPQAFNKVTNRITGQVAAEVADTYSVRAVFLRDQVARWVREVSEEDTSWSRNLEQWYNHAQNTWTALKSCGESLLNFKDAYQIQVELELEEMMNVILGRHVQDVLVCQELPQLFFECLSKLESAQDEDNIVEQDRRFREKLDHIESETIEGCKACFEDLTNPEINRKYQDREHVNKHIAACTRRIQRECTHRRNMWRHDVELAKQSNGERQAKSRIFDTIKENMKNFTWMGNADQQKIAFQQVFRELWDQQLHLTEMSVDRLVSECVADTLMYVRVETEKYVHTSQTLKPGSKNPAPQLRKACFLGLADKRPGTTFCAASLVKDVIKLVSDLQPFEVSFDRFEKQLLDSVREGLRNPFCTEAQIPGFWEHAANTVVSAFVKTETHDQVMQRLGREHKAFSGDIVSNLMAAVRQAKELASKWESNPTRTAEDLLKSLKNEINSVYHEVLSVKGKSWDWSNASSMMVVTLRCQLLTIISHRVMLRLEADRANAEQVAASKDELFETAWVTLCDGATANDVGKLAGRRLSSTLWVYFEKKIKENVGKVHAKINTGEIGKLPEKAVMDAFKDHFGNNIDHGDYQGLAQYLHNPERYLEMRFCSEWSDAAKGPLQDIKNQIDGFVPTIARIKEALKQVLQHLPEDEESDTEQHFDVFTLQEHLCEQCELLPQKATPGSIMLVPDIQTQHTKTTKPRNARMYVDSLLCEFIASTDAWFQQGGKDFYETFYVRTNELMQTSLESLWVCIKGCSKRCPSCGAKCMIEKPDHTEAHQCFAHMSCYLHGIGLSQDPSLPAESNCCMPGHAQTSWEWTHDGTDHQGTTEAMLGDIGRQWLDGQGELPKGWCKNEVEYLSYKKLYERAWMHLRPIMCDLYPSFSQSRFAELEASFEPPSLRSADGSGARVVDSKTFAQLQAQMKNWKRPPLRPCASKTVV